MTQHNNSDSIDEQIDVLEAKKDATTAITMMLDTIEQWRQALQGSPQSDTIEVSGVTRHKTWIINWSFQIRQLGADAFDAFKVKLDFWRKHLPAILWINDNSDDFPKGWNMSAAGSSDVFCSTFYGRSAEQARA